MVTLLLVLACQQPAPPEPGLSAAQLAGYVRPGTADAVGWATDVRAALEAAGQVPDAEHACQVLAIIEQESGYDADPAVPGLAGIVARELQAEAADKLGFLGPAAVSLLLDVTPDGETKSFRERLAEVKTERDVDLVFRDLLAYHQSKAPRLANAVRLVAPGLEDRLNPVRTAGSMQVMVSYARQAAEAVGSDPDKARDALYSRSGGVLYGTLRLFDGAQGYDAPLYRFADYNAGVFASRNAAFQTDLSELTGVSLAPDGDLLAYNRRGRPARQDGQTTTALLEWRSAHAPDLPEWQLRRDLKREKDAEFERTETWRRVRAAWSAERDGTAPAYAVVPDVALDSAKLKGRWTTGDFAERVQRRYDDCLRRGR